jgi:hypothetical protein
MIKAIAGVLVMTVLGLSILPASADMMHKRHCRHHHHHHCHMHR